MRKFSVLSVILACCILLSSKCSSGTKDGASKSVTVGGSLAAGSYAFSPKQDLLDRFMNACISRAYAAVVGDIKEIWGIPVNSNLGIAKAQVDATGKYSIALDPSADYLLLLMKTGNQPSDFISIRAEGNSTLMLIPVKSLTVSSLDLGSATPDGYGNARTDLNTTHLAQNSTLTEPQLNQIALADDVHKSTRDNIANSPTGNPDDSMKAVIRHTFDGNYTEMATTYSKATTLSVNYGIKFEDSNATGRRFGLNDFENMRLANSDGNCEIINLYSPDGNVTSVGYTIINSSNPLTSSTSSTVGWTVEGDYYKLMKGDFGMYKYAGEDNLGIDTNILYGNPPVRENWNFEKKGSPNTLIASFKLNTTLPVDTGNHALIFIPGIEISTTGDNNITAILVKWYQYKNASYVEVDRSVVAMVVDDSEFGIGISDASWNKKFDRNFDIRNDATINVYSVNPNIKYNDSSSAYCINVWYNTGSAGSYNFQWKKI